MTADQHPVWPVPDVTECNCMYLNVPIVVYNRDILAEAILCHSQIAVVESLHYLAFFLLRNMQVGGKCCHDRRHPCKTSQSNEPVVQCIYTAHIVHSRDNGANCWQQQSTRCGLFVGPNSSLVRSKLCWLSLVGASSGCTVSEMCHTRKHLRRCVSYQALAQRQKSPTCCKMVAKTWHSV